MRYVPVEEHGHVQSAVVLLRMVQALNQDRATAAVGLRTKVYPKRVVLEITVERVLGSPQFRA